MAILGTLLKKGIKIREILDQEYSSPFDLQKIQLKSLLLTAASTDFGRSHSFTNILYGFKSSERHLFYDLFKKQVPISNYY